MLAITLVVGLASVAGADPAEALLPRAQPGSAATAGDLAAQVSSEDEALAEAKRTGKKVEVASARGESRDVFATPEGQLEAREYLRPVRTRADGKWVAIDATLAANGGGMVEPKATSVGLAFSDGGVGPLVRLERAGRKLEFTWPGQVPKPMLQGDTAMYADILPDVDLRLGAQADGFTQLLVVKSVEAAKSSELAELRMRLAAVGMTVKETSEGGLVAVDKGADSPVFEAATPMMWDSSTGGGAAARSMPADGGAASKPAPETRATTQDEPAAGASGQLAPVGVDVASSGEELVLTPDQDVLAGPDTVYPVFIDPQWYSPKATAWTMASKYWASSPQWKFNGDSDAGLGYCGWAYCQPYDTKRLFYQIPTSQFAGKTILSAEFVVRETHAASCEAREVQLWRTKGIDSSTTWNSQNASGFWADHIENRSFAYGADGCAAADAEFNVKSVVAQAAAGKWSSITFGMRATSETDPYTWKRFSDDAYLRVNYNRPPAQIKMSQLTQDPGGVCAKPDAAKRVRILPQVRANNVTDPDKDRVRVQFQASWDTGDGKGFTARWTSVASTYKASGSDFSITLPSNLPKNKAVGWHARSNDGAQWSPWSYTGSATSCNTVYDTSVPAGPSVVSTHYPASDPEDPEDPWVDGVGRYGTFTIDSSSSDVSKYWFGVNGDPSSKHTLTTSGGGAKPMKVMPTKPGVNFITAQAFDAAGNGSEISTYQFRVRAGQPDRMTWDMDEGAGAQTVSGSGGAWPAELYGGAEPGAEGVLGKGMELDGKDDYAASPSPVLNTRKSFSVSLWAKPGEVSPDTGSVAIAQAGANRTAYEMYFSPSRSGWVFVRHTADAENSSAARAMQPACVIGDSECAASRRNTWTHVVGVFDNPAGEVKLYINGELAGAAPYSTLWDARGSTLLGATETAGTRNSFFTGSLDEVQLFDYQLTAGQVTKLHDKQPVDTDRPAKLIWPLDEDASATSVTGRAQELAAQLREGAKTGVPGVDGKALELDGIDDYATAGRPVVDTYQSFAVTAWVKLPKDKEERAMTAVAQSSTTLRGFELYHSSALGGWVFARASSDTAGAPLIKAQQNACPVSIPNCPAAGLGEWVHVVGVYDYDAGEIRLYVNGTLKASEPFTTPWLAAGEITLGATVTPSAITSKLKGAMDDVRLYDRTISDDEVQQLFKQRPLVKSRWQLDSATGTPATSSDAAGGAYPLTLNNGAAVGAGWVDSGALVLDGVDDFASTSGVPLDTGASYTVSAWAQAAATPGGPATVISAEGVSQSAFSVRYVPGSVGDIGRWRMSLPDTDSTTATTVTADNQSFYDAAEWNHLALVYDGFADQARLYVNGQLEQVACADSDEDGAPDDASCTDRVSWASNAAAFTATKSLQIGRTKAGATGSDYWPGGIDDVWVFQGALGEAQLSMLAQGWPGLPTEVPAGG
ncbi:LamG domain-containing protein [Streptomyces sp. NPDC055681]